MHSITRFTTVFVALASMMVSMESAMGQDSGSSATAAPQSKPEELSPPVKLLDAGSGEKKMLRYTFTKGAESIMTATGTVEVKASMGGREMPAQTPPPISSKTTATVTDVDAAGLAHLDVSYSGGVSAGNASGKAVVTNTGSVKSLVMTVPADATAAAKSQIEGSRRNIAQYFIPLPDEAVGNGAKWQVTQTLTQQGMTIQQQFTYTMVSRDGDVLQLEVEISQSAAEQDIESPQMPGMKIHLTSLKGAGKGTGKVELSNALIASTKFELATDIDLTMPQVGQMTQHMKASMTGESKVTPAKP